MGLAKIEDTADPGATRPHSPIVRERPADPVVEALNRLDDTMGGFTSVLKTTAQTQSALAAIVQGAGRVKSLTSSTMLAAVAGLVSAWLLLDYSTASWRDAAAAERLTHAQEIERHRSLIQDLRQDHEAEVKLREQEQRELTESVERLKTSVESLETKLDDLPQRLAEALGGGTSPP